MQRLMYVLLRNSMVHSLTQHLQNDITANCSFKKILLGSGGIYYGCLENRAVI